MGLGYMLPGGGLPPNLKIYAVPGTDALCEEDFRFLFQAASLCRREKVRRFLRREDACRSLVAEALVRLAFARETGLMVDESHMRFNSYGKPFVPGLGLHFNIAHSGEWVVCGIDAHEIGVDIEKRHAVDYGIAGRFFSEAENSLLAKAATEAQYAELFFKIWALKESYIKAIGKGMSCSLETFACLPSGDPGAIGFAALDGSLPRRRFHLLDIDDAYACAVCCLGEGGVIPVRIGLAGLIDSLRHLAP